MSEWLAWVLPIDDFSLIINLRNKLISHQKSLTICLTIFFCIIYKEKKKKEMVTVLCGVVIINLSGKQLHIGWLFTFSSCYCCCCSYIKKSGVQGFCLLYLCVLPGHDIAWGNNDWLLMRTGHKCVLWKVKRKQRPTVQDSNL